MSHLLDLPTELLERILALLCHESAQSIQACRQACRTLNAIIACSRLVQYLERVALLGMSDPLLVEGVDVSATLSLADRVTRLGAWEKSWNAFTGSHDDDARVFWQERRPNLRIALPASPSARMKYILATIIDPGPPGSEQEEDWQHDTNDLCSFEPWFITATRTGFDVRASYSYLDLHGCLDGVGGAWGGERAPSRIESSEEENRDGDGDPDTDYDRVHWTVIKVPVRNVLAIALSTELDLALIVSAEVDQGEERCHLVVRPLRLLDGTLHPCAKMPTMRFSVPGVSRLYTMQVQLLGDYLLLWIGHDGDGLVEHSLSRIYLIAWKQGSITLLRECPVGKYGTVHMISNDILALVQLDPLGIELCRLSKMTKKTEGGGGSGDGGATIGRGGTNDGPRMDKLRTLLFPLLRQRQHTGASARVTNAECVGGHAGHQMSPNRPWPEYRSAPLGLRQMFRQSTKDSIVKIMISISGYKGLSRTIEVVVRCATLLAYADGVVLTAPATIVADAETPNGDEDGESKLASVLAQSIVGDANADNDGEGDAGGGGVPWDAWGPWATAASDYPHVGWRVVFGERMVTVEAYPKYQLCIRDYNPYRIQQARGSMAAKGHSDGLGHEEEQDKGEKNADTFHPKVTRRIVESSTLRGGQWFKEDVTTALPHLETKVDLPPDPLGWTGIYLEQDQVLLRMGDIDHLDQVNERPYRRKRFQHIGSEGFALYCI